MQPLNVSSSITVICDWIITCSSDEQSVNSLDLISITEEGMVNLVSFLQPLKALDSIDVTDGGIVILFNDVQLLKVKSLIAALFEGFSIVTSANEAQSQNAWIPIAIPSSDEHLQKELFPIDETEKGASNIKCFNDEQLRKALSPNETAEDDDSNITFSNDIQPRKALHPIENDEEINDEEASNIIWVNEEQSAKAKSPIFVTDRGIDIWINDLHSSKAKSPIVVNDEGPSNVTCVNDEHRRKESFSIVICFKDLHPLKALEHIFWTDEDKMIFSSDEQSAKAYSSINVAEEGKDISVKDMHLSNKEFGKHVILPKILRDLIPKNIFLPNKGNELIVNSDNEMHPLKALSPIEFTDEGIDILVNNWHSLNAHFPIEVTDERISISFNNLHFLNA